jgi:hypothetical protein
MNLINLRKQLNEMDFLIKEIKTKVLKQGKSCIKHPLEKQERNEIYEHKKKLLMIMTLMLLILSGTLISLQSCHRKRLS